MTHHFDHKTFIAERRAMLLKLDPATMRAYLRKYGEKVPANDAAGDTVCMISMHKARTAARDLPMKERSISKRWLLARGLLPMDDGDVPA